MMMMIVARTKRTLWELIYIWGGKCVDGRFVGPSKRRRRRRAQKELKGFVKWRRSRRGEGGGR
jgi:hypothetical protein